VQKDAAVFGTPKRPITKCKKRGRLHWTCRVSELLRNFDESKAWLVHLYRSLVAPCQRLCKSHFRISLHFGPNFDLAIGTRAQAPITRSTRVHFLVSCTSHRCRILDFAAPSFEKTSEQCHVAHLNWMIDLIIALVLVCKDISSIDAHSRFPIALALTLYLTDAQGSSRELIVQDVGFGDGQWRVLRKANNPRKTPTPRAVLFAPEASRYTSMGIALRISQRQKRCSRASASASSAAHCADAVLTFDYSTIWIDLSQHHWKPPT
jgi:hypothetical protein